MNQEQLLLSKKMHEKGMLWSYDASQLDTLSESVLIEHGLIYGDIAEIEQLFRLFSTKKSKKYGKLAYCLIQIIES